MSLESRLRKIEEAMAQQGGRRLIIVADGEEHDEAEIAEFGRRADGPIVCIGGENV